MARQKRAVVDVGRGWGRKGGRRAGERVDCPGSSLSTPGHRLLFCTPSPALARRRCRSVCAWGRAGCPCWMWMREEWSSCVLLRGGESDGRHQRGCGVIGECVDGAKDEEVLGKEDKVSVIRVRDKNRRLTEDKSSCSSSFPRSHCSPSLLRFSIHALSSVFSSSRIGPPLLNEVKYV